MPPDNFLLFDTITAEFVILLDLQGYIGAFVGCFGISERVPIFELDHLQKSDVPVAFWIDFTNLSFQLVRKPSPVSN